MVAVLAGQHPHMQRKSRVYRQCPQKLLHHFDIHFADAALSQFRIKCQKRPAAEIQNDLDQRFIHRDQELPVTANSFFLPGSFVQGLSQHDPDIFHRMVAVHRQIAACLDIERKQAMLGEQCQHMIKKTNSRLDVGFAVSIQDNRYVHLGFLRLAAYRATSDNSRRHLTHCSGPPPLPILHYTPASTASPGDYPPGCQP